MDEKGNIRYTVSLAYEAISSIKKLRLCTLTLELNHKFSDDAVNNN